MPTDKPSRSPLLFIAVAVSAMALVAGCSSGPQEPTGPGTPVLALAHMVGGTSGVTMFAATDATSDLTRARHFTLGADEMAYAAVIGPDGDVYVTGYGDGTIAIVAAADAMAGTGPDASVTASARRFSSPDMTTPSALAFDGRGDLWVVDTLNMDPLEPGPNRLLRFADPGSITDGASVAAATILDLAEEPAGFQAHRLLYVIHIDDDDRLWYTDYFSWSVGRLDDLAGRGAHETDVVPDMQFITWDPTVVDPVVHVANPVGIAISSTGALYLGSHAGDHVYRFDGASTWTGFHDDVQPDAFLAVGIARPRFVAIDDEGALWVLNNADRELARVVGHGTGSGTVSLTPTRTLSWGSWGQVLGGGMSFADR